VSENVNEAREDAKERIEGRDWTEHLMEIVRFRFSFVVHKFAFSPTTGGVTQDEA